MDIDLNWIVQNSNLLQFITNLALVFVTLIYVFYTKRIVDSSNQQIKFSHSPVLGIKINKMEFDTNFGFNHFEITLDVVNLGNAPAIEILIDSEIELKYSDLNGERIIPSTYKPYLIPYLQINEKLTTKLGTSKHFGDIPTRVIISDFKKMHDLNMHRIKNTTVKDSFDACTLRLFVYYKNNLNQSFMSVYETLLSIPPGEDISSLYGMNEGSKLPNNETITVSEHPFKSPLFNAKPINDEIPQIEISARNKKRDRVEY